MAKPRDRELLALAAEHGLTVRDGRHHWKLYTEGGEFVGNWPRSGRSHAHGAERAQKNLVAQIRRAKR